MIVSHTNYKILAYVNTHVAACGMDISRKTKISKGAIYTLLHRLVKRKLLERGIAAYSKIYYITDKGKLAINAFETASRILKNKPLQQ